MVSGLDQVSEIFSTLQAGFSLGLFCSPALSERMNVCHMNTTPKLSWHWFSERAGLALLQ